MESDEEFMKKTIQAFTQSTTRFDSNVESRDSPIMVDSLSDNSNISNNDNDNEAKNQNESQNQNESISTSSISSNSFDSSDNDSSQTSTTKDFVRAKLVDLLR